MLGIDLDLTISHVKILTAILQTQIPVKVFELLANIVDFEFQK